MGESLAGSGQTPAACECFQKLNELSEGLRESDSDIEKSYWAVVLPGLADCYRKLDNLDPAADILQRVTAHFYKQVEDSVSDEPDDGQYDYYDAFDKAESSFLMAASATTNLMTVWYKQKKLAAVRSLLESLDRKDNGYSGTRLIGIMQLNADADGNFHEQLRALVNDTDAFYFIDQTYNAAIEATRPRDMGLTLALQYYRAMLNWLYGAQAGSQDRAFEIWTSIIETTIPDDASARCFEMRINASREFPKAILERAKALGPGSLEANLYIARLESVADRISSVIYDHDKDPAVSLGRYYHLAGDETRAKSVLKRLMKSIFQDWDEDAYGSWKHLTLAYILTALDDDLNATAAWKQLAPYPQSTKIEPALSSDTGDPADKSGMDETNCNHESELSISSEEGDQAKAGTEQGDESATVSPVFGQSIASASINDSQPTEETTETLSSDSPVNADDLSSDSTQWIEFTCNGCDSTTHIWNIYCCKDCLDVQFDGECHSKLKDGLLDKSICNPNHDFLRLPAFERDRWAYLTTNDAVDIGDKEIARKEWLAGIRAEWGVSRETLEQEDQAFSAVMHIERVWKAFRARKNKRVQQGNGGATPA